MYPSLCGTGGLHTPATHPQRTSLSYNRPPMAGVDSGVSIMMWEGGCIHLQQPPRDVQIPQPATHGRRQLGCSRPCAGKGAAHTCSTPPSDVHILQPAPHGRQGLGCIHRFVGEGCAQTHEISLSPNRPPWPARTQVYPLLRVRGGYTRLQHTPTGRTYPPTGSPWPPKTRV